MNFLEDILMGSKQEQDKFNAAQAVAPVAGALPAVAGKAAAAPGVVGALGGPAGIALGLGGALLGGIAEAAQKKRMGEIQGLQAQEQGAKAMSQAQASGLERLMAGYKGILG